MNATRISQAALHLTKSLKHYTPSSLATLGLSSLLTRWTNAKFLMEAAGGSYQRSLISILRLEQISLRHRDSSRRLRKSLRDICLWKSVPAMKTLRDI